MYIHTYGQYVCYNVAYRLTGLLFQRAFYQPCEITNET